jgi:hypothetical protein
MASAGGDVLSFLAPGAVHDLGNAVFALQGHAHLLPDGEARAALLAAVDKLAATLGGLRSLLGDDTPVETTVLLRHLQTFARIALRDQGLRVELDGAAGPPAIVGGAILRTAALALRAFTAGPAEQGVPGTVRVSVEPAGASRIAFLLRWLPDAGQLRFPLDGAGILRAVQDILPAGLEAAMPAPDRLIVWLPAAGTELPGAWGTLPVP